MSEPVSMIEIGELTMPEFQALRSLQSDVESRMKAIGSLECEKMALMQQVQELDEHGKRLLSEIGKRLNIPSTTQWRIQSDGKVLGTPQAVPSVVEA